MEVKPAIEIKASSLPHPSAAQCQCWGMRSPLMAASQQIHHIFVLFTLQTPHHIIDDSLLISQSVRWCMASCVLRHMMPNIYHWSHKEHFLVFIYIKVKIRQSKSVKIHSWGHRSVFTGVFFPDKALNEGSKYLFHLCYCHMNTGVSLGKVNSVYMTVYWLVLFLNVNHKHMFRSKQYISACTVCILVDIYHELISVGI